MMKKLICILLIFVFSFPLIPRLACVASAAEPESSTTRTVWENPWTLTTFGEGNRVNSTFFTFPKVIWNGSQYVDYVFNSSDMSAGIGSVYIKVCPDHTVFYDPDLKEERIANENWAVEYYNVSNPTWQSDSAVDNEVCYVVNSSGIYFNRKSTLESGAVLNAWYWLRIGSELKITVTLNPVLNGNYRLAWALKGVSGIRAEYLTATQNVTQQVTEDSACSSVQFLGANESRCLVDWSDAVFFNSTRQKWETCFRQLKLQKDISDSRCQARILFTDFPLTRGESIVLDPSVQTFNSSIASEGYICCLGSNYPPTEKTCMYTNGTVSFNALLVGQWSEAGLYVQSRSYLSFDTFPIPALAYNISATLNLTTFCLNSPNVNFSVWLLGSNQSNPQPIYNNLTVDSWGCGSLPPIAAWNVSGYPGDGHNVSFTVPPDQINKIDSTEFELMSSEEGIAPLGYEYFGFYPGNSTGNEPKLEVSYCLDTKTIGAETWFYRNISSDKVAVVFFGARPYSNDLFVYCIDNLGEKLLAKVQFLDELISNGFSILTPVRNYLVYNVSGWSYYDQSSTWVYDAVMWLMYNQSYRHILLFGFSGGGVVVSNEIQKDYATRFSAAFMTCAPVNMNLEGYGSMWHSALTAAYTKVATCFAEPVNDNVDAGWGRWIIIPPQMSLYYNNTPSVCYNNGTLANKEWHNWTGGHDFFSQIDNATGENATTVVVDWYSEVHPPNVPFTPTETGSAGPSYTYSSGTYVSNDDNVSYVFYWGDRTNTTTAQYPSGQNVTASHTWAVRGVYNVTVTAYDNVTGLWSTPSPPLAVNMSVVLTISRSGGGGSTTSPVPGTYALRYGANVTVTATPHGKWVFADWLLDSSTYYYNNPITVSMTADHSLLAEFDYNPGPLRVETGG